MFLGNILKYNMNNPNIKYLPSIFKKLSYIQAVYLFGSSASGKTNQKSDLDLAILLKNPIYRSKKMEILTELARNGFCHVDVVFFEGKDSSWSMKPYTIIACFTLKVILIKILSIQTL